jgi:hypothetical protein
MAQEPFRIVLEGRGEREERRYLRGSSMPRKGKCCGLRGCHKDVDRPNYGVRAELTMNLNDRFLFFESLNSPQWQTVVRKIR